MVYPIDSITAPSILRSVAALHTVAAVTSLHKMKNTEREEVGTHNYIRPNHKLVRTI